VVSETSLGAVPSNWLYLSGCVTPKPMPLYSILNGHVQAAIREVFLSFQPTFSACATVRHFHQHHLLFPRRIRQGPHQGEIAWGAIQHHDVLRVLHQPAYAGAYVGWRAPAQPRQQMAMSTFWT
jgi:hypothetical protein